MRVPAITLNNFTNINQNKKKINQNKFIKFGVLCTVYINSEFSEIKNIISLRASLYVQRD